LLKLFRTGGGRRFPMPQYNLGADHNGEGGVLRQIRNSGRMEAAPWEKEVLQPAIGGLKMGGARTSELFQLINSPNSSERRSGGDQGR